jgi:AAHS family 4-hydroxybenzoate transporter-like MFS transporter
MLIARETVIPTSFNFSEAMRERPISRRQLLMVLMLGVLVLFDGMDTQVLGVIAHGIMGDLGVPLSAFGIVFSTGLLGGVVGALVMSPIADRLLGPKRTTVIAMTIAGLATLATPAVGTLTELLAIRFIAGLGLGAATPAIFALASEYAPRKTFRPVTSTLIAFMPLGAFLCGTSGRFLVPAYGWPMLLYVGGVLTLLLAAAAAWVLPESVHFLLLVKKDPRRALRSAKTLYPRLQADGVIVDDVDHDDARKQPLARLFSPDLWRFTVLVWLSGILSQGILYFVLSWTPALLEKSGSAGAVGMNAAAMFGIGGALGTAAQGWLTKKFNIYRVMLLELALYLAAVLTLPFILDDPFLAPATVFLMAAGICAYQTGFVLIVIEAYPSDVRSTGFGWSYGVGRIGATSAPALTGLLVAMGWTPAQIFLGAAFPGIVSAAALIGIRLLLSRRASAATTDRESDPA